MLPWYHLHSLVRLCRISAAQYPLTPVYVQVCLAARKVGFNMKRVAEPFSRWTPLSGTIPVYSSCSDAFKYIVSVILKCFFTPVDCSGRRVDSCGLTARSSESEAQGTKINILITSPIFYGNLIVIMQERQPSCQEGVNKFLVFSDNEM
jgi:hypothetical protein